MFVQLTEALLGKPARQRIDVSEEDAKSLIPKRLAIPDWRMTQATDGQ
jgi:hypothetical protein